MALIFSHKNFIKIIFNRKRHFASFSNLFKQLHFLLSFSKCLSRVEEPSTHTYSHTQLHTHTLQPYRASPRQHTDIHTHRQEGEGRGVCVCIAYCCRVGFANTFFFLMGTAALFLDTAALYRVCSILFGHSALPPPRSGSASRVSPQSCQSHESLWGSWYSVSWANIQSAPPIKEIRRI